MNLPTTYHASAQYSTQAPLHLISSRMENLLHFTIACYFRTWFSSKKRHSRQQRPHQFYHYQHHPTSPPPHTPALAGLQDLHPRTSVPTSTLPIHYPWYTRGQHPGSSPRRYITHAPSAPPENGVVRGGKFCVRPVVAARKEYTVR